MAPKRGFKPWNTGLTKETDIRLKRLSDLYKGKERTEETKRKISEKAKERFKNPKNNPMYGRNHTKETRKKMSENHTDYRGKNHPRYGKKCSAKTRKKISESLKGKYFAELNGNWKGGISCEPYCDVWIDKEYKESIKQRDGNRCLNPTCLCNSKRLGIHHIDYVKKNCEPINLITLCTSCNSRANSDRDWHKAWYKAIIYQRYKI